jgi:hypothetical protein
MPSSRPIIPTMVGPSIDPELMIRMLIIGYVFAIRSERALCRDVTGSIDENDPPQTLGPLSKGLCSAIFLFRTGPRQSECAK